MDIHKLKVGVTGASGFLGVYICRALLRAGATVHGIVRNPAKAAFLEDEGVHFTQADLNDGRSLERAFEGLDVLVSNAALYSLTNMSWQDNYTANKTGTQNVYNAAAVAGIKRIIQISTFGVYRFTPFELLDETSNQLDGHKKEGGAYRATKKLSEDLAWQMAEANDIQLTSIRPSSVYGARDNNIMPYFKSAMKLPALPMPAVHFPLVYGGDVAEAVVGCLENDKSVGRAYNTCGSPDDSLYDFMDAWKRVTGQGPMLAKIPLGVGLRASSERARDEIGFYNRPFGAGLAEVFEESPADML